MLSQIESKLTALIADRLTERTHLTVVQAPRPTASPGAGDGVVVVSLTDVTAATRFEPTQLAVNGTQSRRVMPSQFGARIDFIMRPENGPAGAGARELLLDDMSLVSHGLAGEDFATGRAFTVADPDPGFRVRALLLDTGTISNVSDAGNLTGVLHYRGNGEIWPPGVTQQEGEIRAIQSTIVSLPLEIVARDLVVRAGQLATIRVRSLHGQRLLERDPRRTEPLRLALTVLSDAPPAQRGSITGGEPGTETGFVVVEATPPETSIQYQAPASGISRSRLEYIAIHLAAPDRQRGVFLGSAAVRLEP
jgi:hypothetical protein